jgi:hypothetical protein
MKIYSLIPIPSFRKMGQLVKMSFGGRRERGQHMVLHVDVGLVGCNAMQTRLKCPEDESSMFL